MDTNELLKNIVWLAKEADNLDRIVIINQLKEFSREAAHILANTPKLYWGDRVKLKGSVSMWKTDPQTGSVGTIEGMSWDSYQVKFDDYEDIYDILIGGLERV